jgi:hypothetical protein
MIKPSIYHAFLLFSVCLVAVLGGCSTLEKKITGPGSIFTKTDESVVVKGVYYSGSPDLPLYRSPGGGIVKLLPQYTKLNRDQIQRGFAHVRVDSTGETGWVENAKLLWRLPEAKPSELPPQAKIQPTAEPAAPVVTELPASPQPEPAVAPESPAPATASPSNTPSKPSVAPSIFNPY